MQGINMRPASSREAPRYHPPTLVSHIYPCWIGEEIYLFNSLSGQHNRALVSHAHTILDADSDSAESFGPPVAVGDVDPAEDCQHVRNLRGGQGHVRFNSNALPRLEAVTSRIAWAIVHVQSDVVSEVVGE